jgi:hypothetical protein
MKAKRRGLKFAVVAIAVLAGLVLMGRPIIKNVVAWRPACKPPACYRLESTTPITDEVGAVYTPKVPPIKVVLEIDPSHAKAKFPYALHFRVTLKNISDSEVAIGGEEAVRHINISAKDDEHFYLRVWDPEGRRIEARPADFLKGDVIANIKSGMSGYWPYLELSNSYSSTQTRGLFPGESIATAAFELFPHRRRLRDEWGPHGPSSFWAPEPVADFPGPKPPPVKPGFRVLVGPHFQKPGSYRVQAVYSSSFAGAHPYYPIFDSIPDWIQNKLSRLGMRPPGVWRRIDYKFQTASEIVDIEVRP